MTWDPYKLLGLGLMVASAFIVVVAGWLIYVALTGMGQP
jgi:hypothetical protein